MSSAWIFYKTANVAICQHERRWVERWGVLTCAGRQPGGKGVDGGCGGEREEGGRSGHVESGVGYIARSDVSESLEMWRRGSPEVCRAPYMVASCPFRDVGPLGHGVWVCPGLRGLPPAKPYRVSQA